MTDHPIVSHEKWLKARLDLFNGRSQLIVHQFMFAPYPRGIDALNGAYQFLDLVP